MSVLDYYIHEKAVDIASRKLVGIFIRSYKFHSL